MLTTDPTKRLCIGSESDVEGTSVLSHPWMRQLSGVVLQPLWTGEDNVVNEEILGQLEKFGFPIDYARRCLQMNKHNHITTIYCLLERKSRMLKDGIACPLVTPREASAHVRRESAPAAPRPRPESAGRARPESARGRPEAPAFPDARPGPQSARGPGPAARGYLADGRRPGSAGPARPEPRAAGPRGRPESAREGGTPRAAGVRQISTPVRVGSGSARPGPALPRPGSAGARPDSATRGHPAQRARPASPRVVSPWALAQGRMPPPPGVCSRPAPGTPREYAPLWAPRSTPHRPTRPVTPRGPAASATPRGHARRRRPAALRRPRPRAGPRPPRPRGGRARRGRRRGGRALQGRRAGTRAARRGQ